MRILIFGKSGQVGRELARVSWPEQYSLVHFGRADCDLEDTDAIGRAVRDTGAGIVINAAAYTAVDRAESEPGKAARVNRDAPAAMAFACAKSGAALIHLSTDYVFDGSKTEAYGEDEPIAPLSIYGYTKAEGEAAVRGSIPEHIILRTSWVFASHGTNFVRTVLRLANERPELRIVNDQWGAPTAARDIADAIAAIVRSVAQQRPAWGTFHFTSSEPTTWHGFARSIVELSGLSAKVIPITTADYRAAARRPRYSVLDCGRIGRAYGIAQPSWRRVLTTVLSEIRAGEAMSETIPT
jgi:dTDP-4-dehydrorhamnose reductase